MAASTSEVRLEEDSIPDEPKMDLPKAAEAAHPAQEKSPAPQTIGSAKDKVALPGGVEVSSVEETPRTQQAPPQDPPKPPATDDVEENDPKKAASAEEHPHELMHGRVMRPYASSPRLTCCIGCGVHVFCLLLVGVLQASLGSDFINQSTEVALHIWDNEWFVTSRAVQEGEKICNFDATLSTGQRQQEIDRVTAGLGEYKLDIVYLADSGNMLELDKLRKVKELEDWVTARPGFSEFCLRDTGTEECALPISALVACNVTLTGATDCSAANAMPPGLANCEGTTAEQCYRDRSQWVLSESHLETKVEQYSQVQLDGTQAALRILKPYEAAFGAGNAASGALLSEFWFGFPLAGYQDTGDNAEQQAKDVEEFAEDEIFEHLNTYNDEESDNAKFQIGYNGLGLDQLSIQNLLMQDFGFVALAFVVVWAYVAFMKESIFIATMAMVQIFLCFVWGLVLYRIVFGSFFGTFHIMAIFLLVGIGVDGVFVMGDNFELAAAHDERMSEDLHARLSWMWKYSGNALTVTSLTTAVSFVMNATSVFYGIASFGTFAACLIVANYVSMLFFFPAVISFNRRVFGSSKFLCGIPEYLSNLCKNTSKEQQEEVEKAAKEEKSALVRFFENQFSNFILSHRVKILLLFLAASIFMFIQLPKLTPERGNPVLLPDTHPVRLYELVRRDRFVRGGSIFNTQVQLLFGFDRDPIDDEGKDQSGEGFGDADKIGSQGDVKWAPTWYTDGSQTVTNFAVIGAGMECVAQLCDSAEAKDPLRNTGGPPSYMVEGCFARDVRNYLNGNPQSDGLTWEQAKTNFTDFNDALNRMFAADTGGQYITQQEMGEFTFAENVGGTPLYRFFMFQVRLTSSTDMAAEDGNDLADRWKAWLGSEMSTGACAVTADTFWPMLNVPHFHLFQVQDNLIKEMYNGIVIAIVIALIVLNIATGNFFVGLYAAGSIGMIVVWVMATVPLNGWELGIVENIALVMVPGLSVDYVAHLAESYIHAKFDEREHRVIAMLEHSGVSVVSGSISTLMAGGCLLLCQIVFFPKFGTILICTIAFSILWSLFFFPSLLALIGPVGVQGDWHRIIHPCLQPAVELHKIRGGKVLATQKSLDFAKEKEKEGKRYCTCLGGIVGGK